MGNCGSASSLPIDEDRSQRWVSSSPSTPPLKSKSSTSSMTTTTSTPNTSFYDSLSKKDFTPTTTTSSSSSRSQTSSPAPSVVSYTSQPPPPSPQQQLVQSQNLSKKESQHILDIITKQYQEHQKIIDAMVSFIDFYIRTRPYFHSGKPLTCKCPLHELRQELAIMNYIKKLNKYQPMTLEQFVRQQVQFVLDEDMVCVSLAFKTPFRGSTTTYFMIGHYRCHKCKHKWTYDESMVDQFQRCPQCEAHCYPYLQLPHTFQQDRLPTSEESHHKMAHDCKACKKCQELGRLCIPTMYYTATKFDLDERLKATINT